jgi:hypothetical protein
MDYAVYSDNYKTSDWKLRGMKECLAATLLIVACVPRCQDLSDT